MSQSSMIGRSVMGFVAGFLSVLTFFFATWWALRAGGIIPAVGANGQPVPPIWSMNGVPPFGVPRAINLAFWGGVWGAVLAQIFAGLRGVGYWLAWTLAGVIAVSAVAIFVVPFIKGLPINTPTSQRLLISGLLNGAYGLGAAIWLRLLTSAGRG